MNLLFQNLITYWDKFIENCVATLQMFLISGIFSFIFGLLFGVLLTVFKKGGIKENKIIYSILSIFINIFRSIPFVILLVFLIPFTRAIVGTSIGVRGAIIPLIFGTVPFYARQVETALENVSPGKIEAARSMGSSTFGIIFRVYLHESVPELIRITTITAISLVGLTTMAGAVGAGGLGDFAINYGQGLNHSDIIYACIIVLLLFICLLQFIGSFLAKKTTNRELIRFDKVFNKENKKKYYRNLGILSSIIIVILTIVITVTTISLTDKKKDNVVRIGVCGSNNDQWKAVQYVLNERGYDIDIDLIEFSAYNLPNEALHSGDIDLNSFQHIAYLKNEIKVNNYAITAIGESVIAPLTIYSKKYKTIDDIKASAGTNGTNSVKDNALKIAIPKDSTNQSRGIKLLEQAGLIQVDPAAGYTPELKNIQTYYYNIEIVPQDAATLTTTLNDYAAATINATYAIPAKLIPSRDGLLTESTSSGENPYVNVIVARESEKDNEKYKQIVEAFQSQEVAEYILISYQEAFFPAFNYNPLTDATTEQAKALVERINKEIKL